MANYDARRYSLLIKEVICHKNYEDYEHYLVRWKSEKPKRAVLSWHTLQELSFCMAYVQDYLKAAQLSSRPPPLGGKPTKQEIRGKKRKADDNNGTAQSPSSSTGSSNLSVAFRRRHYEVYNGTLQRRSGMTTPKETSGPNIIQVDATALPNAAMLDIASQTPIYNALEAVRLTFLSQLVSLPGPRVKFLNTRDTETPSLHFRWIDDYVLGEGVERTADDVLEGCTKCRPDMGAGRGCEYTRMCDCLEFAAPDSSEAGLKKMNDEQLEILYAWQRNEDVDTSGLLKRFPYTSTGAQSRCLDSFYLNSRFVIHECNKRCRCGPKCKTRNVQFGRKVELEIFKTPNRGFGLRCLSDLRKGQFIDKYLGELITDKEADIREAATALDPTRASYLFWLDKYVSNNDSNLGFNSGLQASDCYVADSERMGGPTRFINHSCDPNVRLFAVSYNKYDQRIYDLAFFALEFIPAGTELTFDYVDPEPDEDEDKARENRRRKEEKLAGGKNGKRAVNGIEGASKWKRKPCLCGSKNCRGFMWERDQNWSEAGSEDDGVGSAKAGAVSKVKDKKVKEERAQSASDPRVSNRAGGAALGGGRLKPICLD